MLLLKAAGVIPTIEPPDCPPSMRTTSPPPPSKPSGVVFVESTVKSHFPSFPATDLAFHQRKYPNITFLINYLHFLSNNSIDKLHRLQFCGSIISFITHVIVFDLCFGSYRLLRCDKRILLVWKSYFDSSFCEDLFINFDSRVILIRVNLLNFRTFILVGSKYNI